MTVGGMGFIPERLLMMMMILLSCIQYRCFRPFQEQVFPPLTVYSLQACSDNQGP